MRLRNELHTSFYIFYWKKWVQAFLQTSLVWWVNVWARTLASKANSNLLYWLMFVVATPCTCNTNSCKICSSRPVSVTLATCFLILDDAPLFTRQFGLGTRPPNNACRIRLACIYHAQNMYTESAAGQREGRVFTPKVNRDRESDEYRGGKGENGPSWGRRRQLAS